MSKKIGVVLLFLATFNISVLAQEPDKATAQLTAATPHFHEGDEVSFTMTLNEPLPEGPGVKSLRSHQSGVGIQSARIRA